MPYGRPEQYPGQNVVQQPVAAPAPYAAPQEQYNGQWVRPATPQQRMRMQQERDQQQQQRDQQEQARMQQEQARIQAQQAAFSPTLPTGGAQTGGFNPVLPPQMQAQIPQQGAVNPILPPQMQAAIPQQAPQQAPQLRQPNAQAFAHANQNASFMPQGAVESAPFMPPQEQQFGQRPENFGSPQGQQYGRSMDYMSQMGLDRMGGYSPQMPSQQPQAGDWQDRFSQIMGQNWPTQQLSLIHI